MTHGTLSAYKHYCCRCSACRTANAEWQREFAVRKQREGVPPHTHGTLTGYNVYGCRCEPCRDYRAFYSSRARAAKKVQEVTA